MNAQRRMIDLPTQPAQLGAYVLDWGRLRLTGPEGAHKLTPKAGAVLARLLQDAGRTVSRAALFDAAWPGSYSSDEVLTQVMQELRRAFADRARAAPWLVTVPKLGYRWEGPPPQSLEPVAPTQETADAEVREVTRRSAHRVAAPWLLTAAAGLLLLAGLGWRASVAPTSASRALPEARPLLREPWAELEPALSADGALLAYLAVDAGRHALRLRDLPRATERTLVAATDATLGAPMLSPDATRLGYVRRQAGACAVHVLTLADLGDQVLARDCPPTLPTSLAWSAAGDALYYSRAGEGAALAQRSVALHRLALAGGAAQRVSDAGRWLSIDLHPRLSPDGRELAFIRDGGGRNRVVRLDLASARETELDLPLWPYRVAWEGTGLLLAVHAGGGIELWRCDAEGGRLQRLARDGAGPGLTAAGGRIVFERQRADDNLYRLDLRDPTTQPQRVTQETGSELAPRVAPDQKSLAYLSDASGELEVHLRTLPQDTRRQLSQLAPAVPVDLRWSPDARRLALIVGTAKGKRLALLGIDGTRVALPPALQEQVPAQIEWAADGDLWLAVERDGRRELLRARGPGFERVEQVLDGSIAAFALDARGPVLLKPGSARFERLDGTPATTVVAQPRPIDQWSWGEGRLAQAVQTGEGAPSRLQVFALDGTLQRELTLALPEPPLGRHLDLQGDTLWFTRRDRVEADLYQLGSPSGR